eukprot:11302728-Alexandrium_andersonii.AAC.1
MAERTAVRHIQVLAIGRQRGPLVITQRVVALKCRVLACSEDRTALCLCACVAVWSHDHVWSRPHHVHVIFTHSVHSSESDCSDYHCVRLKE